MSRISPVFPLRLSYPLKSFQKQKARPIIRSVGLSHITLLPHHRCGRGCRRRCRRCRGGHGRRRHRCCRRSRRRRRHRCCRRSRRRRRHRRCRRSRRRGRHRRCRRSRRRGRRGSHLGRLHTRLRGRSLALQGDPLEAIPATGHIAANDPVQVSRRSNTKLHAGLCFGKKTRD